MDSQAAQLKFPATPDSTTADAKAGAAGATPASTVGQIYLNDQRFDFHFPDSENARRSLAAIFKGNQYPFVDVPGLEPKAIVDVGANLGASAIVFATQFPSAVVYCFEPSPANVRLLRRNVAPFANVRVFGWGLLDRAEPVRLYTGLDRSMQNSIVRSAETTDAFEEAEVRRASEEFDRLNISGLPTLLKIDTEGCELPILRDLGTRLESVDRLYLEYHADAHRRAIDALLGDRFVLTTAKTVLPHRGSMFYLSRRVLSAAPRLAAAELRGG